MISDDLSQNFFRVYEKKTEDNIQLNNNSFNKNDYTKKALW
jgi:hypothetical protein